MKVRSSIRRMCKHCYRVRRGKRHFIYCKQTPKHKQRQGFHTIAAMRTQQTITLSPIFSSSGSSSNGNCDFVTDTDASSTFHVSGCCHGCNMNDVSMSNGEIDVNNDVSIFGRAMRHSQPPVQPLQNLFRPALGLSSLFLQPPLTSTMIAYDGTTTSSDSEIIVNP